INGEEVAGLYCKPRRTETKPARTPLPEGRRSARDRSRSALMIRPVRKQFRQVPRLLMQLPTNRALSLVVHCDSRVRAKMSGLTRRPQEAGCCKKSSATKHHLLNIR